MVDWRNGTKREGLDSMDCRAGTGGLEGKQGGEIKTGSREIKTNGGELWQRGRGRNGGGVRTGRTRKQ